jgi:hypothetical protein
MLKTRKPVRLKPHYPFLERRILDQQEHEQIIIFQKRFSGPQGAIDKPTELMHQIIGVVNWLAKMSKPEAQLLDRHQIFGTSPGRFSLYALLQTLVLSPSGHSLLYLFCRTSTTAEGQYHG